MSSDDDAAPKQRLWLHGNMLPRHVTHILALASERHRVQYTFSYQLSTQRDRIIHRVLNAVSELSFLRTGAPTIRGSRASWIRYHRRSYRSPKLWIVFEMSVCESLNDMI